MEKSDLTLPQIVLVWLYFRFLYVDKFRNSQRLTLYVLHLTKWINLRKHSIPRNLQIDDLLKIIDSLYNFRFKKKAILAYLGMSKNTFNHKFRECLEEKGYQNKRTFTLFQAYDIVKVWAKDEFWYRLEAFTKAELVEYLHQRNYKKLADEFKTYLGDEKIYKENDKFSPKMIYSFLEHIGYEKDEIKEIFFAKYYKEV
ncbi:hypothetical protein ACT3CE_00370 [Marinifilum sp. RC60d5]|uniref:hypothetical protein n=1 Tax=Marinifilum sp. RC60d5 TaxID=3458414 RepID=UPI004036491A